MSQTIIYRALGMLGLLLSTSTLAQTWTLVSSSNLIFPTPGLPAGSSVQPVAVGQNDSDGQSVRLKIEQNSSFDGHWLRVGSAFQAVARTGLTGALGPSRTGVEMTHEFRQLTQFTTDSGPDGSMAYFAEAGPAGSFGNAFGFWRWQAGQNRELARQGTDGSLGPNLGAGWRFYNTLDTNNIHLNVGPNGVALAQELISPTDQRRAGLVLLRASGNLPCMLQSDSSIALGPNLIPGSIFNSGTYITARHNGQYFIQALASDPALREGIWEVCAGAPRPIAVTGLVGSLGPNVGSSTARFTTIRTRPKPHANGTQVFMATYRLFDAATVLQGAIWRNQNGSNRLLAQTDDTSASFGPNYLAARFEFFDTLNSDFDSADGHVAFKTSVRTPANAAIRGLWRIRPGGNPEPFALIGQTGIVSPGSGTFSEIDRWKLFGNGDVVAYCVVTGGPSGLYLFKPGRTPRLILTANQTIPLQIGASSSIAIVQSFNLVQGNEDTNASASGAGNGIDNWAATDGGILVSASITIGGNTANVLMRLQATDLTTVFADGFED